MTAIAKDLRNNPVSVEGGGSEQEGIRKLLVNIALFINRELTPLIKEMRRELNRVGGDQRGLTFEDLNADGEILVEVADRDLLVSAADGVVLLRLKPSADVTGQRFFIKKVDVSANAVEIRTTDAEQLDVGFVGYDLLVVNEGVEILADGAGYVIVSKVT